VITDQTMPRMTGLELARELAAIRPGVPVILYTGYADGVMDAHLEAAGVRALLKKPVEPAQLLALLRVHLPGGAGRSVIDVPGAGSPDAINTGRRRRG
jgi:CheY-like chemotaxis protein